MNTYTFEVVVNGDYYTGSWEDVLVVYDPSLGFTTGGGWFYWPGTANGDYPGDKTNFGYTMKYNKKGLNVQGGLLVIRHLADGSIYRIKSNALDGLSIIDTGIPGIASFSGKCTYVGPDSPLDSYGLPETEGGLQFTAYVEDWNEPGTGADEFWFNVFGKEFSLDLDGDNRVDSTSDPATNELISLGGGNVVVPHTPSEK